MMILRFEIYIYHFFRKIGKFLDAELLAADGRIQTRCGDGGGNPFFVRPVCECCG